MVEFTASKEKNEKKHYFLNLDLLSITTPSLFYTLSLLQMQGRIHNEKHSLAPCILSQDIASN